MQSTPIVPIQSTKKETLVSSSWQIYWATSFGGYLCGFYLLSQNYKALGYPQLSKKTLMTGVISTLIALLIFFFISDDDFKRSLLLVNVLQGLFCGSYFFYEYYKNFYDLNRLKEFLIACLVISLGAVAAFIYLPKMDIPSIIIPITQGGILQSLAKQCQEDSIKELRQRGNKKYAFFRLCGVILLSIFCQVTFIYGLFFVGVFLGL